jgi:hypothetical protein
MKKLVSQVGGMLLVVGLSAAPSLAANFYHAALLCNGGGSGSASISAKGDVKINVKGLEANGVYTCQALCQCSGPHFVDEACTTDGDGKLKVTFLGAAAGFVCRCPSVEIFSAQQDCISGFNLP